MILVDIYIPSLDRTYDFQVDETVPTGTLIVELTEMIRNKSRFGNAASTEEFMLCSMEQERILQKADSLQSCGIRNGSRLMLV